MSDHYKRLDAKIERARQRALEEAQADRFKTPGAAGPVGDAWPKLPPVPPATDLTPKRQLMNAAEMAEAMRAAMLAQTPDTSQEIIDALPDQGMSLHEPPAVEWLKYFGTDEWNSAHQPDKFYRTRDGKPPAPNMANVASVRSLGAACTGRAFDNQAHAQRLLEELEREITGEPFDQWPIEQQLDYDTITTGSAWLRYTLQPDGTVKRERVDPRSVRYVAPGGYTWPSARAKPAADETVNVSTSEAFSPALWQQAVEEAMGDPEPQIDWRQQIERARAHYAGTQVSQAELQAMAEQTYLRLYELTRPAKMVRPGMAAELKRAKRAGVPPEPFHYGHEPPTEEQRMFRWFFGFDLATEPSKASVHLRNNRGEITGMWFDEAATIDPKAFARFMLGDFKAASQPDRQPVRTSHEERKARAAARPNLPKGPRRNWWD